jgi:molybdopterin synthase catalytic subunit
MSSERKSTVRVRYFAAARELAGTDSEELELLLPCSAAQLLGELAERHPRLSGVIARMRLAVGDELVSMDAEVLAGAEVSVIPPVAGGQPEGERDTKREPELCAIRSERLSIDEAMAAVSDREIGGVALFVGTVRNHAGGKPVALLEYEAHPTLALAELSKIAREVRERHANVKLAILHRVGSLEVGELAVVIAAGAPHRAEAFAACREAIEEIKVRVPIWKKEHAPDGTTHWVNLGGG